MNDYKLNFYSLSVDFIEEFKAIQYNGMPLALFINLRNLLTAGNLHDLLKEKSFRDHGKIRIDNEGDIQGHFTAILDSIRGSDLRSTSHGKVMLYDFLLGKDSFLHYLDPSRVFVMDCQDDPAEKLKDYRVDTAAIWNEMKPRVVTIFQQLAGHPIYSHQGFQDYMTEIGFPGILSTLSMVDHFFEKVPISCVIVGTITDPFSRILTVAAARKGIPSICFEHGLIGFEEDFMPILATKFAVYGHYEKEWYRRRGATEDQVEITGHPRYDWIFANKKLPRTDFQQMWGLNPQKKTILLAPYQGSDITPINLFIWYFSQKYPGAELLLKPHPHEFAHNTIKNYDLLFYNYPQLKVVSGHAIYMLPNVDLAVICEQSTMGLEALLYNTPVVFLKPEQENPALVEDYFDGMGRFRSSDPQELAGIAADLISGNGTVIGEYLKRRHEFLSWHYPTIASMKAVRELIHRVTGVSFNHPTNRPFNG